MLSVLYFETMRPETNDQYRLASDIDPGDVGAVGSIAVPANSSVYATIVRPYNLPSVPMVLLNVGIQAPEGVNVQTILPVPQPNTPGIFGTLVELSIANTTDSEQQVGLNFHVLTGVDIASKF